MTREMVCTVCPSSCRLVVTEENGAVTVTGNTCKRGEQHGINEFLNPMRMLTSTVAVTGGTLPRLPVITTGEVPKGRLRACLDEVYRARVAAPVRCGDVIIENLCGTGVDLVASRTMKAKEAL